jgi:hypothetical protein
MAGTPVTTVPPPAPIDTTPAPAPALPPGDNSMQQSFGAVRALAQQPDPWKALDARYTAPAAPPTPVPGAAVPIDPSQPIADRIAQAPQLVAPAPPAGFLARVGEAFKGGIGQSLTDLANSAKSAAGGKPGAEAPPADYAKTMQWGDLAHPEEALEKAIYQIAHGAPVLAAGIGGGVAGGAIGAEGGAVAGAEGGAVVGPEGAAAGAVVGGAVGGAGGALTGGALGAGAMSAAQELGPFYAAALKASPNDPAAAFHQALARAGTAGVFSAAGWALFGLKPFAGAVQNLMFQAFGVQPAVTAGGTVADNAITGAPLTQGVVESMPGAVIGTALPAMAHAAVGALAGAPGAAAPAEAPAGDLAPASDTPVTPAGAPAQPVGEGAAADSQQPASGAPVPAVEPAAPVQDAATIRPREDGGGGGTVPPAPTVATPEIGAALAAPKDAAPAAPAEEKPDVTAIGDVKADPVQISPDASKNALDYIDGKTGENPVKVNLAYIGTDNIADTLQRVSSMLPGQGVQSHESTMALALSLNMQPDQFLAGYKGSQLDAAQTTAMRLMLDSSAQQLVTFAKAATNPNSGSPVAMAQFMRAFTAHQGIQQYFENARAEAGRTLNAYQMMSRTSRDMTKAVGDLITNAGGADAITDLAERIGDLDDPEKVNELVAVSRKMSSRDMALYGFYNVILSNIPHVLAKKLTSDVMAGTWEMGVRALAARLPGSEVVPGEATQMAYGYASSFMDALRVAGRGLATGEHQFDGSTTLDPIGSRVRSLADGAPPDLNTDQPTRAMSEYLKMALPTRWIGAADDFAKFMNYRAELRALAYRYAVKSGTLPEDLDGHIGEIMAAPSDAMHQQARANALRTTFQEPLQGVAKAIQNTADQINIPLPNTDFKIPFGRMVVPFVKIPSNLLAWVYRNSPVAAAFPTEQIKADLAAGGVRRDVQIARMTMGTGLALAAAGLAVNGQITGRGPSDPDLNAAWRRAGHSPYSIMGVNYSQVDPIGMYLGAIADSYDIMRFAPEQSRYDTAASLGFGLGNALMSKTYMSGLANFFDALQTPDRDGSKYVDNFVGSLAAPGAVKGLTDATDPWLRAHYSLLDGIEARLPMVSQKLPMDRNLWGDPIAKADGFLPGLSGTGVARAVSPVTYDNAAANAQPIDKWIWDNRQYFPHADTGQLDLKKPGAVQTFQAGRAIGVNLQLSPQQLDRFQEQAGNGLKMPGTGLGTKDYLNALVNGDNPDTAAQQKWNSDSPAMQAVTVQSIVSSMRSAAKKQLLGEFPDLNEAFTAGAHARASQLTDANGVRQPGSGP